MSSIAEQVPPDFVERFRVLVTATACERVSYGCTGLKCADASAFGVLLDELGQHLAGIDWFSHPSVAAACLEAGVDYSELFGVPPSARDLEGADLEKKESGDLGEVVAVLHLLAHHAVDPRYLFAKNVLKLYERSSVPGVDAISIQLLADAPAQELAAGEGMTLIEGKVSDKGSLTSLANEAVNSIAATTRHRIQRELLLIAAELRARADPDARLPLLLAAFIKRLPSVSAHGVLLSSTEIGAPHEKDAVSRYNADRPIQITHLTIDVAHLRAAAFAYRRRV